jgi:hypothetical protein
MSFFYQICLASLYESSFIRFARSWPSVAAKNEGVKTGFHDYGL